MALIFLTGCKNQNLPAPITVPVKSYEKKESPAELQINGTYELSVDAEIYADPADNDPFEILEKGSSVKILDEAENGFVRIDYFGNQGYIPTKYLKEF